MTISRGVSGVAREVTQQWRGVSGVARNIAEEWRGVSGVARRTFLYDLISNVERVDIVVDDTNIQVCEMDGNTVGATLFTGYDDCSTYGTLTTGSNYVSVQAKTGTSGKLFWAATFAVVVMKTGGYYYLMDFLSKLADNESLAFSITNNTSVVGSGTYASISSFGGYSFGKSETKVFGKADISEMFGRMGSQYISASCLVKHTFNSFKLTDKNGTVYDIPIQIVTQY